MPGNVGLPLTRRRPSRLLPHRTAGAIVALALPLLAQSPAPGRASPRDLSGLLPDSTVLLVELGSGPAFAAGLREWLARVELPPRLRLVAGLVPALVRGATALDPDELQAALLPYGAALAVVHDGQALEPLVLSRVRPSRDLDRLVARYADRVAADVQDGVLALARNREALARYREFAASGRPRLGGRPGFADGRPGLPRGPGLRVFVDVAALRRDRSAWAMADPGARFLIGPLARLWDRASRFDGRLELVDGGIELQGGLDASVLDDELGRSLFAGGADGYRLPPAPQRTLATLVLDRSLARFWRGLDRFLDASALAQANGFLSIADALLGASFVDELLPALAEPIALFAVADDDDPERAESALAVDVPALVLVARLRDPAAERLLDKAWRALVFVTQIERRQRGEPAFHLRPTRHTGGPLLVAEPEEWRGQEPAPVATRLSPTLAFCDGHAVLATTRRGAELALESLWGGSAARAAGDFLSGSPAAIASWVARNRDVLALGEVLDKGKTMREARDGLDVFADVLRVFAGARLALEPRTDGTTALTLHAELTR